MTTPVDELRSAAALLRQRATAATPGPWRNDPDMLDNGSILSDSPEVNPGWGCLVSEQASTRDADSKWFATVDPLVGLALAELLEHIGDDMDDDGAEEAPIAESKLAVRSTIPTTYWRWDWTASLALARLILGGTS